MDGLDDHIATTRHGGAGILWVGVVGCTIRASEATAARKVPDTLNTKRRIPFGPVPTLPLPAPKRETSCDEAGIQTSWVWPMSMLGLCSPGLLTVSEEILQEIVGEFY